MMDLFVFNVLIDFMLKMVIVSKFKIVVKHIINKMDNVINVIVDIIIIKMDVNH